MAYNKIKFSVIFARELLISSSPIFLISRFVIAYFQKDTVDFLICCKINYLIFKVIRITHENVKIKILVHERMGSKILCSHIVFFLNLRLMFL